MWRNTVCIGNRISGVRPLSYHWATVSVFYASPENFKKAGNVLINETFRRGRVTIVAGKSNIYSVFWVCVCSLDYPTCRGMHCIISSSVFCPPVSYLSTLSDKGHDFRGKKLLYKKSFLIFCTTFFRNIAHSKKNSARYCSKFISFHVKYPFILVGTWIFLTDIRKNTQISNFLRIPPAELSCFTWTDKHDEANSLFSQFCNAPRNVTVGFLMSVWPHVNFSRSFVKWAFTKFCENVFRFC